MSSSRAFSLPGLRRVVMVCLVGTVGFMGATPSAWGANHSVSLDVPFVPTPPDVVDRMLQVAQVGPEDFVIDLGSGDGRIAIAAVRNHGAKGAMGVDIDPERIAEARVNAKEAGVSDKVEFLNQDLFDTDFSKASVLTMYLLPNVNVSLRPKVLQLSPGTRVVSHAFDMDEWEPDHYERVDGRSVYMWVVPAAVEGNWKLEGPQGELTLDLVQRFQYVTGTAHDATGKTLPVTGSLKGSALRLVMGEGDAARSLSGSVHGSSMVLAGAGGGSGTGSGSDTGSAAEAGAGAGAGAGTGGGDIGRGTGTGAPDQKWQGSRQ